MTDARCAPELRRSFGERKLFPRRVRRKVRVDRRITDNGRIL